MTCQSSEVARESLAVDQSTAELTARQVDASFRGSYKTGNFRLLLPVTRQ